MPTTFDGGDHRRGRHVVSALHVPVVPRDEVPQGVFDGDTLRYCKTAMRKVCADFEANLKEFDAEAGHGHLLVNSLKGVPGRRLRSEHTGRVNRAKMSGHFCSPS
jgi:putative transposase